MCVCVCVEDNCLKVNTTHICAIEVLNSRINLQKLERHLILRNFHLYIIFKSKTGSKHWSRYPSQREREISSLIFFCWPQKFFHCCLFLVNVYASHVKMCIHRQNADKTHTKSKKRRRERKAMKIRRNLSSSF